MLCVRTPVSWVPITLNLGVHVVMYFYYALAAVSTKPIWWKRYLTTMQILQFVLDLGFINVCLYVRYAADLDMAADTGMGTGRDGGWWWLPVVAQLPRPTWDMGLPHVSGELAVYFPRLFQSIRPYPKALWAQQATCSGTWPAAIAGWLLINSYLLLFIEFFWKTYKKKNTKATATAASTTDTDTATGTATAPAAKAVKLE